ncbi:PH domain-containing protein [Jeotgalibacillus soli]|uniref:Uncharacterized protein YyaB-like PH domain-containing protein n=1 Tax=Jeotgalibacillus soli TaxID=889306 RepID=A0A0C2VXR9_9BACL|nr:PH domain-containing protein [Jeotgalibacillus soli]KIL49221.1 hypothetical protein KP78_06890 [Jeotgalibacillus soli]
MKFVVKKNPIIVLIILMLPVLTVSLPFLEPNDPGLWIGIAITAIMSFLMLWALFQSYYEITEESITLVFGPIRKTLRLNQLKSVNYSYNPISSPAWTFKRVKFVYGSFNDFLFGSVPKEEEAFWQALRDRCSDAAKLPR